jgi:hypothetical protein
VVGGVEVLPLAVLVLTVGMLIVMSGWAVVDSRQAVASAARAAVRTAVEASDLDAGLAAGDEAARRQLADGGRRPERLDLRWSVAEASFSRCSRLVVTADYRLSALAVPWVGGVGPVLTVRATATELVDPHRDGLSGVACVA